MASWKGHLGFGLLTAVFYLGFCASVFAISWLYSPLLFSAVVIGAFLPDLDSNTSVPVRILFRSMTVIGAIVSGYIIYQTETDPVLYLLIGPLGAALLIHFVVFALFKKMTTHRGIFHSLPAIAISSLSFLIMLRFAKAPKQLGVLLAVGLGLGYFSHLFLDKLFGAVTLSGAAFKPNAGAGDPLKLYSKHLVVNILSYGLLFVLLYLNLDFLNSVSQELFQAIR